MISTKNKALSLWLALLMIVVSFLCVFCNGNFKVNAAAGDTVYCQNDANWGTVYAYMWNSSSDNNAAWPGVAMTNDGDGVWSYKLTSDYANIIFNNGSGTQTDDMTYQGHGKIYNNKTGSWSDYQNAAPTSATSASTETSVTNPTALSNTMIVYCKNSAGWSKVNAYMWNSSTDANAGWPGVSMTKIEDDVWQYVIPKKFSKIIFNDGSTQTSDLTFPGDGYIYDNKSGQWDIYDTSPLKVKSFTTDLTSPQYAGMDITISASASGVGEVYYRYTVTDSNNKTTVLSDYSAESSVVWNPSATGTYKIKLELIDGANNTNSREKTFEILSDALLEKPIIKVVSPKNGNEILVDQPVSIDITASGGKTGTNLLFYKVAIYDKNENLVNVPYYTLNNTYSFTPSMIGSYKVVVSVQSSDNTTVSKTYYYSSVQEFSYDKTLAVASLLPTGTAEVGNTIEINAAAVGGTSPYTYQFTVDGNVVQAYSASSKYNMNLTSPGEYTVAVTVKDSKGDTADKSIVINVGGDPTIKLGDADMDGDITIYDSAIIQKYLCKWITEDQINLINADVDKSGDVDIYDAELIQKKLAHIISGF